MLPDTVRLVDDPDSPKGRKEIRESGRPASARLCIENDTGRILDYFPDILYTSSKNRNRDPISENSLKSREDIIRMANDYARKALLPMDGMRTNMVRFRRPKKDTNYYGYELAMTRFRNVEGIGEIELPDVLMINIDAETGELDLLSYREFPITIILVSPTVSKDDAISMAKRLCGPDPTDTVNVDLMVYQGEFPTYEKQTLTWHVMLSNGPLLEKGYRQDAIIDAASGNVLRAAKIR